MPHDLALEPLELGGRDERGVVECGGERGHALLVRRCRGEHVVFLVEPRERGADPLPDRVARLGRSGGDACDPLLADGPPALGVAGLERFAEPPLELDQGERGLLAAELRIGLFQALDQPLGRRLDAAGILHFRQQPADVGAIPQRGRLGGLGLDLPEPRLFKGAEVVDPDRVIGVLRRQLAHHPDPLAQRGRCVASRRWFRSSSCSGCSCA